MFESLQVGKVYKVRLGRGGRNPTPFKLVDELSTSGLVWFRSVRPEGVSRAKTYWARSYFEARVIGGPYDRGTEPFHG